MGRFPRWEWGRSAGRENVHCKFQKDYTPKFNSVYLCGVGLQFFFLQTYLHFLTSLQQAYKRKQKALSLPFTSWVTSPFCTFFSSSLKRNIPLPLSARAGRIQGDKSGHQLGMLQTGRCLYIYILNMCVSLMSPIQLLASTNLGFPKCLYWVEQHPLKIYVHPEHVTVTLFGDKVFADVTKLR